MKRLSTVLFALALLLPAGSALAKDYVIAVSQIVEHPALDAMRQGFKDELKDKGLAATYREYNAQGSMDLAIQIASQILGDKPDLVMTIATPTSQAVAQKVKDIPVLFTGVTDPVAAGLVKSLESPGANISGMTDKSPVDRQVALILEVMPKLKRLGYVYNAGEANSVVSFEQAKAECAKHGVNVVPSTIANSSEVYAAAKSLVGNCEAVFIPTDNTVVSALESLIKVCEEAKLPLFASDTDSVARGAVAALAIDYYRMGRQTGRMAERILVKGEKPAAMPVETLKDLQLYVNAKAAGRMGLTVPQAVTGRADKVF